jgi:hypothetical protein
MNETPGLVLLSATMLPSSRFYSTTICFAVTVFDFGSDMTL